ncbi:MAG: hypothetical protein OEM01_01985 [Desulfobulbaceae bacterium]|nr:hypothetical protein [Desulfobulbaceae bacterium]
MKDFTKKSKQGRRIFLGTFERVEIRLAEYKELNSIGKRNFLDDIKLQFKIA